MSPYNIHVNNAFEIAKDLGESVETFDELVKLFKSLAPEKFNKYSSIINTSKRTFSIIYAPVVESKQTFEFYR